MLVLWVTHTLPMLVVESDADLLNGQNRVMAAFAFAFVVVVVVADSHDLHLNSCFPLEHSIDWYWNPLAIGILAMKTTHLAAAWSCTIYILWD